ncbi:unnamed protein product [marine sediment metagenome]|uniref:Uncharacterized protein n=1 Tax=marine sediment metagenome TaxID=412755 RepID=X1J7R3_9ZZZZ
MVTERNRPLAPSSAEEVKQVGVEDIDPRLIQQLVSLDDNEVIVPLRMKREDVSKVKAVKLSDDEVVKVSKFQLYLYDRGYLRDNTFASLFCYLFNVGFTLHKQLAEEEARKEVATP